jgi:hypothetical protein
MKITPGQAFMNIAGTLIFLGLAILGWGGFAAFFSHAVLATVAAATLVRAGAGLFSSANLSAGEREARGRVLIRLRCDRITGRVATGLHRPEGLLDLRW